MTFKEVTMRINDEWNEKYWPASDTYKFCLHFILQAIIEIVKYEFTGQILEDKFVFTFK